MADDGSRKLDRRSQNSAKIFATSKGSYVKTNDMRRRLFEDKIFRRRVCLEDAIQEDGDACDTDMEDDEV